MFRDLKTLDLSAMSRSEIRALVDASEFGSIIPDNFEVVGTEELLFIPTDAFWERWKMAKARIEGEGCRVYGYRNFLPNIRGINEHWRVQWQIKCLLIPDDYCRICNQEHNADDAGYCQHCKEPVIFP